MIIMSLIIILRKHDTHYACYYFVDYVDYFDKVLIFIFIILLLLCNKICEHPLFCS
jgi:hypothetical protein